MTDKKKDEEKVQLEEVMEIIKHLSIPFPGAEIPSNMEIVAKKDKSGVVLREDSFIADGVRGMIMGSLLSGKRVKILTNFHSLQEICSKIPDKCPECERDLKDLNFYLISIEDGAGSAVLLECFCGNKILVQDYDG